MTDFEVTSVKSPCHAPSKKGGEMCGTFTSCAVEVTNIGPGRRKVLVRLCDACKTAGYEPVEVRISEGNVREVSWYYHGGVVGWHTLVTSHGSRGVIPQGE